MTQSLKPVVDRLEDLFAKFNERFYNGELQKPIITVSPDTAGGSYGWCTCFKAWTNESKNEGYYEINITAEYLNRPIRQVCGTLLHEMVHLWNLQTGIKDTSRGNSYHNKKFKTEAEKRGLIIDHDPKYGWTLTSLNQEAEDFITELNLEPFELKRSKMLKVEKTGGSGKSSSRKYVCPDCGLIIRATKEVKVICGMCGVEFELEE